MKTLYSEERQRVALAQAMVGRLYISDAVEKKGERDDFIYQCLYKNRIKDKQAGKGLIGQIGGL